MTKSVISIAILATLPLIGCGASMQGQAQVPEHLRTDNDRYAEAWRDAFARYEGEVELAATRTYNSPTEAEAVAASVTEQRFTGLLETELNSHGLTLRGFRQHEAHHPELTAMLDQDFGERVTHVRTVAARIPTRVDPMGSWQIAFDRTDETSGRIATR